MEYSIEKRLPCVPANPTLYFFVEEYTLYLYVQSCSKVKGVTPFIFVNNVTEFLNLWSHLGDGIS